MWTLSQVSLDTGSAVVVLGAKGLCYGTQKAELAAVSKALLRVREVLNRLHLGLC